MQADRTPPMTTMLLRCMMSRAARPDRRPRESCDGEDVVPLVRSAPAAGPPGIRADSVVLIVVLAAIVVWRW
jgi:hypothetical protein